MRDHDGQNAHEEAYLSSFGYGLSQGLSILNEREEEVIKLYYGLGCDAITIAQQDFKDFTQPAEKSIIVMNPPYGERISTPNLLNTYKMIGERFKRAFAGNEAWVLSYREECFEQIGLKPSIKIPVYNGSLECEFRKYVMFDGKMKEFRSEGGIVKTEREKSEMAQKHRFKKEREFKKRVSEETENEEDDIRSFKFHTHRLEDFEKKRAEFHKGGRSRIGGGRGPGDDVRKVWCRRMYLRLQRCNGRGGQPWSV